MAATPTSTKPRGRKRKSPATASASAVADVLPAVSSAVSAAQEFLLRHDLLLLPSHSLALESSLSKIHSKLKPPQKPKPPGGGDGGDCGGAAWFDRFLAAASDDGDPRWVDTFRMSRPTFSLLSSILSDHLTSSLPSLPPDSALGAALYRLAHNASFCSVGRRFGMTSADACRAFYTVVKLICNQLGFYLGRLGSEMGRISSGFERFSLPNCCGVLGLEKFEVFGNILGENGFVMVQGLVDSDGKFLDVSAGWPSTFPPSSIFPQTRLFSSVEQSKEFLNGSPYEFSDGELLPQYILGESCYPLLSWLLTPYVKRSEKDELGFKEMEFNYVHGLAMGCVRVAFRRVRANWRLLDRRWKEESVEFLPFVVIAACLLNNFLMDHGEKIEEDGESDCGVEEEDCDFPAFEGEASEGGLRSRDLLCNAP